MIRKSVALLAVATCLLPAAPLPAQEHVASPQDLAARLSAAEVQRQRDLAAVDAFLARPETAAAARGVGADLGQLRSGLTALGDAELAQLAARASALADPAAGLDQDIRTLLIIFLIVAIVILVLQAVD